MMLADDRPKRPAIRYHGSKFRQSKHIAQFIPEPRLFGVRYFDLYCEPFGGGANPLLQLPRFPLEIYNDLNGDVVNFFSVLRSREDELIRAINLTPYAKGEWELSFESCNNPLERARRFYVRCYLSIAGGTVREGTNPGFRRQVNLTTKPDGTQAMTPAAISFMNTKHLHQVANRMRGVQIESDDAISIIERYDSRFSFFYIDPPYVFDTRSKWANSAYAHEMTNEDHRELAKVLINVEGMVLLSGYRTPIYDELYSGWVRVDRDFRVNNSDKRTESLWLSPRLVDVLAQQAAARERESLPLLAIMKDAV